MAESIKGTAQAGWRQLQIPTRLSLRQVVQGSAFAPRVCWKAIGLADRWSVSVETVEQMIERGELQAIRIAGLHRVPDLERVRIEAESNNTEAA